MAPVDSFIARIHSNRWHRYFYVCCRVLLAYAFVVAGMVKIFGERFASGLSELHPMGAYLTALHETGVYYGFIGMAQVVAAVLILIPRTAALGAVLYFPIILNICVLSIAVRFEGSMVSTPLMVLANAYVLFWNHAKLKPLFSWKTPHLGPIAGQVQSMDSRFPIGFFAGVSACVLLVLLLAQTGFEIVPRNSMKDCLMQYQGTPYEAAAVRFCECVHLEGSGLATCLDQFKMQQAQIDSTLD